eukprot:3901291-Prymnesium_polylepis.1
MAQRADHLGERGSSHHPRPVRGCWSLNMSMLQLPTADSRDVPRMCPRYHGCPRYRCVACGLWCAVRRYRALRGSA